ncbi:MAG TPA: LiaF domain-containing protein [Acidimicrobiia bacterium]|nr:LiaF domain-containing protein [Acidimicrobiia bacterium]
METLDRAPVLEAPTPAPIKRRGFGSILLGVTFIGLGLLWTLDLAGVLEVRAAVVLPAMLMVIGLGLILGSRDGPHSGLVAMGVLITIAVIIAAAVPLTPFAGGVGDRHFRITEESQLETTYRIGMGNLVLDLSDLRLADEASVSVEVGAGELTVLLPAEVPVDVDATTGAGEVNLLGQRTDGVGVSREYRSDGFLTAPIRLSLDLEVGAGSIEVTR